MTKPKLTRVPPTLSCDDHGRYVKAEATDGSTVLVDVTDWLALWSGRRRLTLTVRNFKGRPSVTLGVRKPDGAWTNTTLGRALLAPADPEALVYFVDGDPRNCRRHNMKLGTPADVGAARKSRRYFGDATAEVD